MSSGRIDNNIYDGSIPTDRKDIIDTPSLAFFKEGKALNALSHEWKNYIDPR